MERLLDNLHKHITAVAVLVLVVGGLFAIMKYEHDQTTQRQAEIATTIKLKEIDNQKLDEQNKVLRQQNSTQNAQMQAVLKDLQKQKEQINNSQQAVDVLSRLLQSRNVPVPTVDAQGNATFKADDVIPLAKEAVACQQDHVELASCKTTVSIQEKELANNQDKLKNKDDEIAELKKGTKGSFTQRVKHDAKVILVWEVVKNGIKIIFKRGGIKL